MIGNYFLDEDLAPWAQHLVETRYTGRVVMYLMLNPHPNARHITDQFNISSEMIKSIQPKPQQEFLRNRFDIDDQFQFTPVDVCMIIEFFEKSKLRFAQTSLSATAFYTPSYADFFPEKEGKKTNPSQWDMHRIQEFTININRENKRYIECAPGAHHELMIVTNMLNTNVLRKSCVFEPNVQQPEPKTVELLNKMRQSRGKLVWNRRHTIRYLKSKAKFRQSSRKSFFQLELIKTILRPNPFRSMALDNSEEHKQWCSKIIQEIFAK
jgi:hypothetical protein